MLKDQITKLKCFPIGVNLTRRSSKPKDSNLYLEVFDPVKVLTRIKLHNYLSDTISMTSKFIREFMEINTIERKGILYSHQFSKEETYIFIL